MRKKLAIGGILLVSMIIAGFLILNYLSSLGPVGGRFAVIQDINEDQINVEASDDVTWNQLVELNANGTWMWIGGYIEQYGNEWGFRFTPDSIVIAEITAEGSQSTISGISGEIDYWLAYGIVYVFANVTNVVTYTE